MPLPARLFDGLLATSGTWDRTDWYEVVAPEELGSPVPGLPGRDRARRSAADAFAVQSGGARAAARCPGWADLSRTASHVPPTPTCAGRSATPRRGVGLSSSSPAGSPGRPCCGGFCASAARPISSSATTGAPVSRPGTGLPAHGTGASSSSCRRSPSRRHRPGSPGSTGPVPTASRDDGTERDVAGHVEIRWSHGRFAQPPEAKVYLDTPMSSLPGYHPLDAVGPAPAHPVAGGPLIPW